MFNYKLTIQYKGTNYSGWQIQENADTVQRRIKSVCETILRYDVNLIGSGRTDAGVHALGQVANFKCENEIDIPSFQHSLNSILPFDISVSSVELVHENFHSRFDAKRRSYLYFISTKKSPFYKDYSYYYRSRTELNIGDLNLLSKEFIGKHDFTSFAKANSETENKVCTVFDIGWRNVKGIVLFKIEADRFLHGMVRAIVGTILTAAENSFDENYIINIFEKHNRSEAGRTVPSEGLFLYKVRY
ncbi:MAG: tRNA pseudouridine(38-40) synthase TruA [Bacteroidetes bacterium]|nr:tRNA pseudouridine(38-40) synthase TruA [Bacteroidota bacterium]